MIPSLPLLRPRILLMAALILALLISFSVMALAQSGDDISGTVFFDSNGNGSRDAGENGANNVWVTASDGVHAPMTVSTANGGVYTLVGLAPGQYTVNITLPTGYIATTAASMTAQTGQNPGPTFGIAIPLLITGTIWHDADNDGTQGLTEAGIPAAVVAIFADQDGDGQIGPYEPMLGSAATDSQGNYRIPPSPQPASILPGLHVARIQLPPGYAPGGSGLAETPLLLISSELGANTRYLDWPAVSASSGPSALYGSLWNDVDGNEIIDAGEGPLTSVTLGLIGMDGSPVAKARTDAAGQYRLANLTAGSYELVIDPTTLPGGWTPSFDLAVLELQLVSGTETRLDLGYYNTLAVAPLRQSEWKNELKQKGRPHYSPAELQAFIAAAEQGSQVFAEAVSLETALLQSQPGAEGRARKEYAALQLNLASKRLLSGTPVKLGGLSAATTVGAAVTEVESLLWPPAARTRQTYDRVRDIAKELNKGKSVGYGANSVLRLAQGIYRGKDVTSKLRPAGDGVDMILDDPATLLRWDPGTLPAGTNVFNPQLRVKVKAFYEGGVLEAIHVLPDGRQISLGIATPVVWNKDVNVFYAFNLWRVATVAELANMQVILITRDPDNDGGKVEHIKVDSAELILDY